MTEVESNQTVNPVSSVLTGDAFDGALASFRGRIGHYGWMWWLLRQRARRHGQFPWGAFSHLQRFGRAQKPYFIGRTADGTQYLGDYREHYSAVLATFPWNEAGLFKFINQAATSHAGAYLDVGANAGVTAAIVARTAGPAKQVIAFEPIPATACRAAATFALNDVRQVRLMQVALSDRNEQSTMHLPAGNSGAASLIDGMSAEFCSEVPVVCRTLDSMLEDEAFGEIGLIKIDIEGHELCMLKGARELLERERPAVLFEYNMDAAARAGWSLPDVAELLNEHGHYRLRQIDNDGVLHDLAPKYGPRFVNMFAEPIE